MGSLLFSMAAVMTLTSTPASTPHFSASFLPAVPAHVAWRVAWTKTHPVPPKTTRLFASPLAALPQAQGSADNAQPAARPIAIEYSDAYQTRRKIHKYASFATLPLFGAEVALGQSLYNNSTNVDTRRGAHAAIGAGIVGLFAVNTVTGAWNLFGEGRKDPNGRALRLAHGLLMMAADVGFVLTTESGPNSQGRQGALTFATDKVTHRNIAVASISVATAGYLLMIFGNH
jgi:hypothetical protein